VCTVCSVGVEEVWGAGGRQVTAPACDAAVACPAAASNGRVVGAPTRRPAGACEAACRCLRGGLPVPAREGLTSREDSMRSASLKSSLLV